MNAKRNNNEVNNQLAFEKFCKLLQKGYYIHVELKSKLRDKASFWITATKENGEREEIQLFLNQEILDLVLNYLESGVLGDISKINPCDLDSFYERDLEFKKELFQREKRKGKTVAWSYTVLGKLASMHYKQGVIIFHPYTLRNNPVNIAIPKTKQKTISISREALLEIEINNLNFGSSYSLQVLSEYYALASSRKEKEVIGNNRFMNGKKMKKQEKYKQKTSLSLPKLQRRSKHQVLFNS